MNNRIYDKDIYKNQFTMTSIIMTKLSCPHCYSLDIGVVKGDTCICNSCKSIIEFKELLTQPQVRNKKIEDILK
jgi:hypothetical protein